MEREADRIADAVTTGAMAPASKPALPPSASPPASSPSDFTTGPGAPLDTATRGYFETRLGRNLADVRVHADGTAARAAKSIGARAYADGAHIGFAQGAYAPATATGRHLLAHELAHVSLHNRSAAPVLRRNPDGGVTPTAAVPPVAQPEGAAAVPAPSAATRGLVEAALASRDPADVKKIHDYGGLSAEQKFELIGILLNQGWVGPQDEWALEAIWGSFGDGVVAVASSHLELWNNCIDRGAELDSLPAITRLKANFSADVRAIVTANLFQNRDLVRSELERMGLGLLESEEVGPPTAQQAEEIQEMQVAATLIAKLQKAQEMVRGNVRVGYEPAPQQNSFMELGEGSMGQNTPVLPMFMPVYFDPYNRPVLTEDPNDRLLGHSGHVTPYDDVKANYDLAGEHIARWLNGYPALYAITRQGRSADTQTFSSQPDAATARRQLGVAMRALIGDIEGAQAKLNGGDLEPLDLTPVQGQLLGGAPAASGVNWSLPLQRSIATGLVEGHEFNKALISMGLQMASQALFMLAPFTGGASLFVALAGVGVLGVKAYRSAQDFATLDQASKTAVRPGTELVTTGRVEAAQRAAEADQVALTLAAIAVGTTAAVSAVGAIGPALAAADSLAVRNIVAADLEIANALKQRALLGPIPEAELVALQEVGLVTRTAQRWANYRGFQVFYRGQTAATAELLSPAARAGGVPASEALVARMRAQGLSDQEIANYTATWNDKPVPGFMAPPGMANQPLGAAGIPTTRLLNIASDFAQSPTGIIYVLRIPKHVPIQIGTGGWGSMSALEQEYVVFHQIPNGYVVRVMPSQGIAPLRFDSPGGVPSLAVPPSTP